MQVMPKLGPMGMQTLQTLFLITFKFEYTLLLILEISLFETKCFSNIEFGDG